MPGGFDKGIFTTPWIQARSPVFNLAFHYYSQYLRGFSSKKQKKVHVVLTEKLADEVSSIVDYDEELPEEKTIEILESLLEELSHEEKLILLLKYKEKHPIRDIQISMGLSESAVKMRLLRAKEKLNKMYAHRLKGPV